MLPAVVGYWLKLSCKIMLELGNYIREMLSQLLNSYWDLTDLAKNS